MPHVDLTRGSHWVADYNILQSIIAANGQSPKSHVIQATSMVFNMEISKSVSFDLRSKGGLDRRNDQHPCFYILPAI
jgi:hypothetical protein